VQKAVQFEIPVEPVRDVTAPVTVEPEPSPWNDPLAALAGRAQAPLSAVLAAAAPVTVAP
jgi:hypothetical protein